YFAPGQGLGYYHDGWGASDSFFGFHFRPNQEDVDHMPTQFGNWQIYRKGEWAVTHPLDYGGPTYWGEGVNCLLFANPPAMTEVRKQLASEFTPDYGYGAGLNWGQYYWQGYYNAPPTFVQEWTRSFFYLPSLDKKSATLVIYDRANADAPTGISQYDTNEQDRIRSAKAR